MSDLLDFRLGITPEIDVVLTAIADARNLDKAAVAREALATWADQQIDVSRAIHAALDSPRDPAPTQARAERAAVRPSIRIKVFERDNYTCRICGAGRHSGDQLHVDHIQPISAGGRSVMDNLQTLCAPCNLGKHTRVDVADVPTACAPPSRDAESSGGRTK